MERLSLAQARRIALAAQGFGRTHPAAVTMRQIQGQIDRLAQFQIDSVNVCVRAQYMPLFSRLGPYDRALLDRAAGQPPRRLFEYWGHAASLIDVRLQPYLRFRMEAAWKESWGSVRRIEREQPGLVAQVLDDVVKYGPVSARDVGTDEPRRHDNWGWNWSSVKTALEWHQWRGSVTSARRNTQFERLYDLPERVLPAAIADQPTPSIQESCLELVRRAAIALGVADLSALADYFRLDRPRTAAAVSQLENSGELVPVEVAGHPGKMWLWRQARLPRRVRVAALISPFDSLIFERTRASRLFGLDYRIEIYLPAAQRAHGYYVYPFLLDEAFVARVDLKADRRTGVLRVQASWREPGTEVQRERVCAELVAQLRSLAGWLGLEGVRAEPRGDLSTGLIARLNSEHFS